MTRKKNTEKKDSITKQEQTHHENSCEQQADTDVSAGDVKTEVEDFKEAIAKDAETDSKEAELIEKLAEMQDKYLRLMAEFENYRKRTLREKIELTRSAGENILKGILPVLDDFERALMLMGEISECNAIKEGIGLIYNKFRDFLKQNGIREIESLNCEFNVDLHEAINKVAVEDESMKGKVVEVLQKGYYLNDKVIRFSKVVVGE